MYIPTHCALLPLTLSLSLSKSQRLLLSLSLSSVWRYRHLQRLSPVSVMEDDWDLHAVVRGCTTVSSASSSVVTTVSSSSSSSGFNFPVFAGSEKVGQVLSLSSDLDPFEARTVTASAAAAATASSSIEELHELCRPFFSKSPSSSSSFSYSSSSAPNKPLHTQQKPQQNLQTKHKTMSHAGSLSTAPRSKRRKNQLKKVCQVPAESLSSDIWAWRKYGQKPIKGSPYPRGYYRCSSSKGCLARKQVERNRSDPTMFIVTYTAEHNHPAPTHRNSLAGSTRQKPSTSPIAADSSSDKATAKPCSPATSGVEEEEEEELAPQSTELESKVEMEDLMDEEEDDEFGLSDTVLTDDFFDGLDELTGLPPPPLLPPAVATVTGDCFTDPFSAGFALPAWAANSTATATATAAGGNY